MTIAQTLRAEHQILRDLQQRCLDTEGDSGLRRQLWYRLKSELLGHALAEEHAVYSRLLEREGTHDIAAHSVEEHRTLEELMDQLDHLGFDRPQWKITLQRLVEVSNHHLDEEEEELFPVVGRTLDASAQTEAIAQYRAHKKALLLDQHATLTQTTQTGVDARTYESRSLDQLHALARERDIDPSEHTRSELISRLRGTPAADHHA